MSYEAAIRRLEEIVAALTSGSTPLSTALELFEEGVRMVRAADAALAGVDARIKELMGNAAD